MTGFPTPDTQRWSSEQAALQQRVAVLEQQIARMTSGPVAVTSSTHPPSPWAGMIIFETDTDNVLVWDGSTWRTIQTGAWTPYTPVWTAGTTNPSKGNGALAGSWAQIGRTAIVQGVLTLGTSTTFGAGAWKMSLPTTAASDAVGSVWVNTASAANRAGAGFAGLGGDMFNVFFGSDGTFNPWDAMTPFDWTTAGAGTVMGWTLTVGTA